RRRPDESGGAGICAARHPHRVGRPGLHRHAAAREPGRRRTQRARRASPDRPAGPRHGSRRARPVAQLGQGVIRHRRLLPDRRGIPRPMKKAARMKLFIGNKNYSSWSMRPWVLMRHAQIPFDEVMVRFDSFAPDSSFKRSLAGLSPTGKVPVLQTEVDGRVQVIWDTLSIAEFLAELYPDRRLWPAARAARARARSIVAEMHS